MAVVDSPVVLLSVLVQLPSICLTSCPSSPGGTRPLTTYLWWREEVCGCPWYKQQWTSILIGEVFVYSKVLGCGAVENANMGIPSEVVNIISLVCQVDESYHRHHAP